jgi:hypothetical protein
MQFFADCPICKVKVANAALTRGSLENLRNGTGDVFIAHSTDGAGDHKWAVTGAQELRRLREIFCEIQ